VCQVKILAVHASQSHKSLAVCCRILDIHLLSQDSAQRLISVLLLQAIGDILKS
jgi:hypothetical protein